MAVMSAEVSLADDFGSVGQGGEFLDRQGIEFGPDHHGRTIIRSPIDGRHPMPAQVSDDRVRFARPQRLRDHPGRLDLFA
ncbi:hypothetical protein D3C86_1985640 [compost metagenome]